MHISCRSKHHKYKLMHINTEKTFLYLRHYQHTAGFAVLPRDLFLACFPSTWSTETPTTLCLRCTERLATIGYSDQLDRFAFLQLTEVLGSGWAFKRTSAVFLTWAYCFNGQKENFSKKKFT